MTTLTGTSTYMPIDDECLRWLLTTLHLTTVLYHFAILSLNIDSNKWYLFG